MGCYVKTASNVNIYVEDLNPEGSKTILFIHGWPGSHRLFEYQFNQLPKLGYRCVGIDIRGFGKSDKPWKGYCYDTYADDVRCVVDALNLKCFTLAGHSMGGATAIRYMARHNGYGVSKLALFAAAAPSIIQRPYFPYGVPKETVIDIINQTYNDRPNMLINFKNMFFFQNISQPLSDWFFNIGLEAAGWATAMAAADWLDEESLFTDMCKICVPTLILHGVHDSVCLFPLAEVQKKSIKNAKLVPFECSGHGLFYEERDRFNEELVKFIEG